MPTAIRRLLTLSTLLSTLLGTLGWSHPACDMMTGAVASFATADVKSGAEAARNGAETDAGRSDSPCHQPGESPDHSAGSTATICPMVAHCASAVLTPSAPLASPPVLADAPRQPRATTPLDPGHEPELQPPKA